MNPVVGRILSHKSSRKCICGGKVRWKRWRLMLCDDCAANSNLRNFAFSRVVYENESTPSEVKNAHMAGMVHYATLYFDACPPNPSGQPAGEARSDAPRC
jgi:hypothetical protein